MSGGQDDAMHDIDSSGGCELHKCKPYEVMLNEADLCRLLKECEDDELLASQLRQRIEDAEDVRDVKAAIAEGGKIPNEEFRNKLPVGLREIEMTSEAIKQVEAMLAAKPISPIVEPKDLPSFNELLNMPSEPCPWFEEEKENDVSETEWRPKVGDRVRVTCDYGPYARKGDVGVVETAREDQCYVQLGHHHGRWWIEYPSLEPQPQEDKKENDVSKLDLSKPCEALNIYDDIDSDNWWPVHGCPVWDRGSHYYCFKEKKDGKLECYWVHRDRIRNVCESKYEPQSRELFEKDTNDMSEELDLSKPCEATFNAVTWFSVVGPPVWDRNQHYGCFREDLGGVLSFSWYPRERIRNVRSPQYEPHTMETLLSLANEWIDRGSSAVRISWLSKECVVLSNSATKWNYIELQSFTWATGPHAGKPVAREVGIRERNEQKS